MRIHGYNDHYRDYEKNLFLGENYRVFVDDPSVSASEDDDELTDEERAEREDEEEARRQETKDAWEKEWRLRYPEEMATEGTEFAREIRAMIPGKIDYEPDQRNAIKNRWDALLTEYNATNAYVDHFQRLINEVQLKAYDPVRSPRWRTRFERFYESMDQLRELEESGKFVADIDQAQRNLNEEIEYEKRAIIEDLQKIHTELIKARTRTLDKIEQELRSDFETRINWLQDKWENEPPRGYEAPEHRLSFVTALEEAKKTIRKDLPPLRVSAQEYNRVWRDIVRMEDKYRLAQEGSDFEYNHGELENELSTLHDLYRQEIMPISLDYEEKVDEAIARMEKLIATAESSDAFKESFMKERKNEKGKKEEYFDEEAYNSQLAGYRATIENLKRSRDLKKITMDALDNSAPMTVKKQIPDPNDKSKMITVEEPLYVQFDDEPFLLDGQPVPMPQGLRQQLDLLKSLPLNEEEQRQFARAIKDGFDQYRKGIYESKKYMTEGLPILIDKANQQIEGLNPPQGKGETWKWSFIAPYDVYRAFEIIKEWSTRRYQRAATARIGDFGSNTLNFLNKAPWPLSPLRTLPNEFDKKVEEAEQQEVNQYKEVYANKDMWQVEDVAYNTKNKDELKACLWLLAENGRLRWDRDELLQQFNNFQDVIEFRSLRSELQDLSGFYERLRIACGHIWDFDTFKDLKRTNSSSYDSKKQEYEQNCHEWAESDAQLSGIIAGMLERHKADPENAKVDPILYEKIIDYAVKYGKMGPEEKLYYLIQGIATGLLASDRGSVLNGVYINDFPAIDYFGSSTVRGKKPTFEDIQDIAKLDQTMFNEWFHNVAMTMPRVTQRVDKTLTQGNKLDHDDLTCYLAYMGEQTTETMLKAYSDGFRLPQTGVQNATVGMLFYMDHMAENYDQIWNSKEQLKRFIGTFTIFDGILQNNMYRDDKNYFRWTSTNYNETPRSSKNYKKMYGRDAASGLDRDMTSGENMEQVQAYISLMDKDFFEPIFAGRIQTDQDVANHMNMLVEKYGGGAKGQATVNEIFQGSPPKNRDNLYRSVSMYAGWLIENRPNQVEDMFSQIRADHAVAFDRIEAANQGVSVRSRIAAGDNTYAGRMVA